jgi:RNA polymerase primary sigma factor
MDGTTAMMKRSHANISPLSQVRKQNRMNLRAGAGAAQLRLNPEDERTLKGLLTKPMDFIDSPVFHEADAEQKVYDDAPAIPKPDTSWYHPLMDDPNGNRSRELQRRANVLLTGAEEGVLFRQFNYARFRIREIQLELGMDDGPAQREPTAEQADEMLRWSRKSTRLREQIAETNLALVLAMAKRTRMSEVDFGDLVSEGNMALLRAVDKFDAERGFKFSTYACRAILKAFSRQGMKLSKYRQRFPADFDPSLEKSNNLETRRRDLEVDAATRVGEIVRNNRCELTEIEQMVIEHRFGLDSGDDAPSMTLEQVGQIIGVTKERVRQIQNKALDKIRTDLEENFLSRVHVEKKPSERSVLIGSN